MSYAVLFLASWWLLWIVVPRLPVHWRLVAGCVVGFGIVMEVSMMYREVQLRERTVAHLVCVAPLRVGPNASYGSCGMLKPGERVVVTQDGGEWCCIMSSGCSGWVPRTALEIEL